MNLFKHINWLLNQSWLQGLISLIPISLLLKYMNYLQTFSITHITFFLFLTAIFLGISTLLTVKSFVANQKFLIRRIKVDRTGECYCPRCNTFLSIRRDRAVHQHISHFYCPKCSENIRPIDEIGKVMCAIAFYLEMKQNPPTCNQGLEITNKNLR